MHFPDILYTLCDTRLLIPLSAFGIDLTLPIQWPDTSLETQHLLLEPRLHPTLLNHRYLLASRRCQHATK